MGVWPMNIARICSPSSRWGLTAASTFRFWRSSMCSPGTGAGPAMVGRARRTRQRAWLDPRPEHLGGQLGHLGEVAAYPHALGLERLGLGLGRAARAGHDRAGVAHGLSRRRGEAGDVADHRLGDVLGDVVGAPLLLVAPDLADHDDQLGLRVVLEEGDDVYEGGADDGVAADPDDRRVAEAALGQLVADLVGERAAAGDEADVALREEVGRDDPHVGLAGREDSG